MNILQNEAFVESNHVKTPQDLFGIFKDLNIEYTLYNHAPIFTVEEGEHLKAEIPGEHCRNLFLRNKKKHMYLVVAANDTKIDLKKLGAYLSAGRFSFASADRLWRVLGVKPGSVCPFAVINDVENTVTVILDAYMMAQDTVCYHPLDNSMTVGLSPADLLRFLEHTGHSPQVVDLSLVAPNIL